MGSSFCDPTREVCPFGAPIDPTLALVNNLYVRAAADPVKTPPPGVQGPITPPGVNPDAGFIPGFTPKVQQMSIRQAPLIFTGNTRSPWIPNVSVTIPPISFGGPPPFQQTRQPPLLPGRIPPGPQVVFPGAQGCGTCGKQPCGQAVDSSGCCPKGCHPDKKWGVKCVRNRRMNALNPRALRRALRRVDQFESFVNKTAKLTGLRLAKKSTRRK